MTYFCTKNYKQIADNEKLLLVVVVASTMIWHLAVAKVLSKWLIFRI